MNIKKATMSAVLASAAVSAFAASVPEVTSVIMSQPSNSRLVTIAYTLGEAPAVVTLDVQTNATANAPANDPGWASIGGKAVWNATGDVWKKIEPGSRTITWRPDLSWPDHKIADNRARAVVTAWATNNTPDYMVVDITATGGADTQTYYPAADFVPRGVTNGIYKTTMLLMRKIMAKDVTWTMGSVSESGRSVSNEKPHQVTLTNNYYIGVYPVTQTQWYQITGYNNSNFNTEYAMRPVDNVCYNEMRNSNSTAGNAANNWPNSPNDNSFLGKLRNTTKLDFDLPSEAQWEFAARAGNGEGYWGNGSAIQISSDKDPNLNLLARYKNNPTTNLSPDAATITPSEGGTAIVGSYVENNWGLYDTAGNVWECCLDLFESDITALNGAVNTSGSNRVLRGGGWNSPAGGCRSAQRRGDIGSNVRQNYVGVRVVCTAGLQ